MNRTGLTVVLAGPEVAAWLREHAARPGSYMTIEGGPFVRLVAAEHARGWDGPDEATFAVAWPIERTPDPLKLARHALECVAEITDGLPRRARHLQINVEGA